MRRTNVGAILVTIAFALAVVALARYVGSNLLFDWVAPAFLGSVGACLAIVTFPKSGILRVVCIIFMVVLAINYAGLSHHFHLEAVKRGKAYADSLGAVLEKYKATHGAFPDSLDNIAGLPPGMEYGTYGGGYYVIIFDPQSIDYDVYDSRDGTWRRDN